MTVQVQTPEAESPPSIDTRQMAENLMRIMASLTDIVERETELVRQGKVRDAMNLEPQKSEMSRQYVSTITQMKRDQDFAKTTPDIISALHDHHEAYRERLKTNLTVLATAHAVSEGIVRGVNSELQRKNMPSGYTSAGKRATPGPRSATPLAVYRSL